jgi:hypothetical protein
MESSDHNETLPSDTAKTVAANDDDGDCSTLGEHAQLQTMADADHEVSLIYLSQIGIYLFTGHEFSHQE